MPLLDRDHRVIAVDLLGHGGSEKPASGYSIDEPGGPGRRGAGRLGVRDAEVVGHSLGGAVATALAEQSPQLVDRLVIIDSAPDERLRRASASSPNCRFAPVIGEALWRIKPDFAIKKGLEVAFAPGFDVPDAFVDDVKRMTYSSYDDSAEAFDDYTGEEPLDQRIAETGKPLLAIMGAEEQIINDPQQALAAYRATVPGAETELIAGAGHSPERRETGPDRGAVLGFAPASRSAVESHAPGTNCKKRCRIGEPSGGTPRLRTHVRFEDNTHWTADRRRRPADRLRHARRVRARARRKARRACQSRRRPQPAGPDGAAARDRPGPWRRRIPCAVERASDGGPAADRRSPVVARRRGA